MGEGGDAMFFFIVFSGCGVSSPSCKCLICARQTASNEWSLLPTPIRNWVGSKTLRPGHSTTCQLPHRFKQGVPPFFHKIDVSCFGVPKFLSIALVTHCRRLPVSCGYFIECARTAEFFILFPQGPPCPKGSGALKLLFFPCH